MYLRFSWKKLLCLYIMSKHLVFIRNLICIIELYCLYLWIIEIKFPWHQLMGHCDLGQFKFTMLAKWVFLYVVEAAMSLSRNLFLKEEDCISQGKKSCKVLCTLYWLFVFLTYLIVPVKATRYWMRGSELGHCFIWIIFKALVFTNWQLLQWDPSYM